MKKYAVQLPFAGYVIVHVEAENEKDAIAAAHDECEARVTASGNTELGEWETLTHIVQGNVCRAPLSKAEAELEGDEVAS